MGPGAPAATPVAQGSALFELNCAPCHGPTGGGGYIGHAEHPPHIAGASVAKIFKQVRSGGKEMPAFSSTVLPDASLDVLASYVHESLAHPVKPAHIGPNTVDPFLIGLFVWGALAVAVCGLALLFGEARN